MFHNPKPTEQDPPEGIVIHPEPEYSEAEPKEKKDP